MKHLFLGLALACGLMMAVPPTQAAADSDSGSWTGSTLKSSGAPELDATLAGSAIVLLLGGVAYLVSRRREDD